MCVTGSQRPEWKKIETKPKTEIVYVKHGVANRFNDYIELHEDLKDYPDLHEFILRHENKHTSGKYTWNDLKLDIAIPPIDKILDVLKFMITRPKTWIQLSPIYKSRGIYYKDPSKIIFWVLIIGIVLVI